MNALKPQEISPHPHHLIYQIESVGMTGAMEPANLSLVLSVASRRTPMAAAFFVVRATVADPARRAAFDKWYQNEHLPDAVRCFGARKAWRFWSLGDPAIHLAMYEFADEAALARAMQSEDLERLVGDFNRDWPDVTRTRETLLLAEAFEV